MAVVLGSAMLLAQARPQPGVRLPLTEIDAQMFHVSAGKRLKPTATRAPLGHAFGFSRLPALTWNICASI